MNCYVLHTYYVPGPSIYTVSLTFPSASTWQVGFILTVQMRHLRSGRSAFQKAELVSSRARLQLKRV